MISCAHEVEAIKDIEARWDSDLTNLSTFRLKSQGDLIEVKSLEALRALVILLNKRGVQYRALGWGANQVLAPLESEVLIKLNFPFENSYFDTIHEEYVLPASVALTTLTSHALKFSLSGWEVLTGIPASLGGALFMNAGTSHGEIKKIVKTVSVMDREGVVRVETIDQGHFSYRKNHFVKPGEIIVGAVLLHHGIDEAIPEKIRHYLELRKNSQPLATKNCGCVFQNYSTTQQAGRLIDLTGLKGLSVGALRVSMKHANFIENTGGASADDFHKLVKLINQQMFLHWGVKFELEVKAL